jgi:hypothetical protein
MPRSAPTFGRWGAEGVIGCARVALAHEAEFAPVPAPSLLLGW